MILPFDDVLILRRHFNGMTAGRQQQGDYTDLDLPIHKAKGCGIKAGATIRGILEIFAGSCARQTQRGKRSVHS